MNFANGPHITDFYFNLFLSFCFPISYWEFVIFASVHGSHQSVIILKRDILFTKTCVTKLP